LKGLVLVHGRQGLPLERDLCLVSCLVSLLQQSLQEFDLLQELGDLRLQPFDPAQRVLPTGASGRSMLQQ